MDKQFDDVERPSHYCYSRIQPLHVIEEWQLPFHVATALKYLARYRHKGQAVLDLRKAVFYLQRYIEVLENEEAGSSASDTRPD